MVSDGIKIEWSDHLDLISRGVLDRLTLGKAVGVIRRGGRAEVLGVKGVFSVHMKIAKIRIAQRVRCRRCAIQQIHHGL